MIVSGTARYFVRVLSFKNIRADNKSFQKIFSLDYFVQAFFVAELLVLRWRH
jgi:hypothetical protein